MDIVKKSLAYSLITTIIVFTIGFLANVALDYGRAEIIDDSLKETTLRAEAYLLQQEFYDLTGSYSCEQLENQILSLQQQFENLSVDISLFKGQTSAVKTEYDLLLARQAQSQLRYLYSLEAVGEHCNVSNDVVLFFFRIDDESSVTQSYILQDMKRESSILVLGFNLDSSEPSLRRFTARYNITAPTIMVKYGSYPLVLYKKDLVVLLAT